MNRRKAKQISHNRKLLYTSLGGNFWKVLNCNLLINDVPISSYGIFCPTASTPLCELIKTFIHSQQAINFLILKVIWIQP